MPQKFFATKEDTSEPLANTQITANKHGVMHQTNPVIMEMLDNIQSGDHVLDIGCAYGVSSIPALKKGAVVYSNDTNHQHLSEVLSQAIKNNVSEHLHLIHGSFPNIDLPENSFDHILLSHILPFLLDETTLNAAFAKLYQWLKPGGKIYILSYTIYNRLMRNYVPIYEQRKSKGELLPGAITNANDFWDTDNPLCELLPTQLNHFSPEILSYFLIQANFGNILTTFVNYQAYIPKAVHLAGQECVRATATKPWV